jgi:hypothetical protein
MAENSGGFLLLMGSKKGLILTSCRDVGIGGRLVSSGLAPAVSLLWHAFQPPRRLSPGNFCLGVQMRVSHLRQCGRVEGVRASAAAPGTIVRTIVTAPGLPDDSHHRR